MNILFLHTNLLKQDPSKIIQMSHLTQLDKKWTKQVLSVCSGRLMLFSFLRYWGSDIFTRVTTEENS